ncbi:MAG: hypothetical protein BWX69_02617 [Planctomycetes bacterium ADurb.Bin069]|nr:MAG: hypothetical protein BWX69_02617 [Planctomycetes bacterium ADurb.Bin069]
MLQYAHRFVAPSRILLLALPRILVPGVINPQWRVDMNAETCTKSGTETFRAGAPMPFKSELPSDLRERVEEFSQTNNLLDLYMRYSWNGDTWKAGFPKIRELELRLSNSDRSYGITLKDVKAVVEWSMDCPGKVTCHSDIVMPANVLQNKEGRAEPKLEDDPTCPMLKFDGSLRGAGPTYRTKVLRFALPREYGAIDTCCVRAFGREGRGWLDLKNVQGGHGPRIYTNKTCWPSQYGVWINILRHLAGTLPAKCKHPQQFLNAGIRRSGVWECADVEMALFWFAYTAQ